jgi:hypothetical protein
VNLTRSGTKFRYVGVAMLILIVGGSGCQSILKPPGSKTALEPQGNAAVGPNGYSVELHSNWSNPSTTRKPFSGPVPLQKVVEESGATRRHRNLEVTVVRVSKDTGQIVRMKAKYDPKRREIAPQYDYDILANDHVIIKPDNSTPLDDVVKPLNNLVGGERL